MKTSSRFGGQNHTGLALRSKLRVGFLGPLSKIGANILSALPMEIGFVYSGWINARS
jgi:hypothetical protein